MPTAEHPIRFVWLLKFSLPFFLAIFLFLVALISKPDRIVDAIGPLIIWASLFFVFILSRAKFSISFRQDGLYVTQLTKQVLIPYANIDQIYINQDILDKIFQSKNLLLKTNSPPERLLGMAMVNGVGFPGLRGNILTIPGLKSEDIIHIKNSLLNYRKDLPEINELGLGHPYYNKAVLAYNYSVIGMVIFTTILFVVLGLLYFYLKIILKV